MILVVPVWASFFTLDEYERFIAIIERDLDRRGDVNFADGVAELDIEGGGQHRLGLQNLAQMCKQIEPEEWEGFVREHFDRVIVSSHTHDLDELGRDFDAVRALLKVRLYARDALGELTEGTIHRPLGDELVSVLVYDLPDAVATVPIDAPSHWTCTLDEAFEIGLRNVLDQDEVEVDTIEVDGGVRFFAMLGESFFVTSRLLVIDDYLETLPTMGAIVAVPNRHTLLFAPILDLSVVSTIQAMAMLAQARYEEGPGSLVSTVFWWCDGAMTPLPVEINEYGVQFSPPQEFIEGCLERLAKPSAYGPN